MSHWENFENVMFYDFIYLAKGFRMRPKVRSTLKRYSTSEFNMQINQVKYMRWNLQKRRLFLRWNLDVLMWNAIFMSYDK